MNFSSILLLLFSVIFTFPYSQRRITVIAHRGDHANAPENTLKAFKDAIANGADYIEVDLRTSSDGQLLVIHDATVNRTSNGHGQVRNLTFTELRALKVMDKDRPQLGMHQMPSFEEVLLQSKGKIRIYLDFKDADVSQTMTLIRKHSMKNDVAVYINAFEQYLQWRKIAPEIPLMVSLPDSVNKTSVLRQFLAQVDADILDGRPSHYSADMVTFAHKLGKKIWVDVQSKEEGPSQWSEAAALGVDGLQTDHPGALIVWLNGIKK